ncbi:MAG: hypothetical protein DSY80_06400 [Desulfocapsa sp.]|nr:MAG: hypothetical protein DSY80_06400 [Desulfocapsa sp.]
MQTRNIHYKSGYKHQLAVTYEIQTEIYPTEHAEIRDFILLRPDGLLTVLKNYAWDGATAIIDTRYNLRASLVHDALYQLMREGVLSGEYREAADKLFRQLCVEDGVFPVIASGYYWALRQFGAAAIKADNARKMKHAPGCKYGDELY